MNRSEFVDILSKRTQISKNRCNIFLKEFRDVILEVCCKGEQVALRDFGKFSMQEKKARKFINPQTKRYYISPAKKIINFKGYKNFVASVK